MGSETPHPSVVKPAISPLRKPAGLINQTGNRPGGTVTGSYKAIPSREPIMSLEAFGDGDDHDGYVTTERAEELFAAGLQAMREMLARFVEQGGNPVIANSMRLNWNPSWGKDPGKPETIVNDCWEA